MEPLLKFEIAFQLNADGTKTDITDTHIKENKIAFPTEVNLKDAK